MSYYIQWSAFSKLSTVKYLSFKCMLFTVKSLCERPSFARKRGPLVYTLGGPKCLHELMNSLCFSRTSALSPLSVPKSLSGPHRVLPFLFQQYTTTHVKGTCHAMQKYLSKYHCLFFLLSKLRLQWGYCPSVLLSQSHAGFAGRRQAAVTR